MIRRKSRYCFIEPLLIPPADDDVVSAFEEFLGETESDSFG
jgi:hypothetical protein